MTYRPGVTLLELIMVMMILAIIAVGVVPLMSLGEQTQVYAAADRLAADLNYARHLAITRGESITVRFYPILEKYQIEDSDGVIDNPVTKQSYEVDFPNDKRLSSVDIVQVNFDLTYKVRFDYQGAPYNGWGTSLNSGQVTLRADSETQYVTVEPVTGVISVEN